MRCGFREIKRSPGPFRLVDRRVTEMGFRSKPETRASHSRKPERAGLVLTAQKKHDGSGLGTLGHPLPTSVHRIDRFPASVILAAE